MVHAIYPFLALLVLILFLKRRQYLAPIEVVAVYLFSCILYIVTVAVFSITVFVPELLQTTTDWKLLPHVYMNRMLISPMLIVLFVNLMQGTHSWPPRILYSGLWVGILMGLEWLNDYYGLLTHTDWRIWYSPLMWVAMLLLSLWFLKWFQSVRRKEQIE